MVWLRHGVDIWHLDCHLSDDKHDFIASVTRSKESFVLKIGSPSEQKMVKKSFTSITSLNEYLRVIGIEQLQL
ncbi:MAG: hypothetical protein ACE5KA_08720 [Nitrososphaerales archaeon]